MALQAAEKGQGTFSLVGYGIRCGRGHQGSETLGDTSDQTADRSSGKGSSAAAPESTMAYGSWMEGLHHVSTQRTSMPRLPPHDPADLSPVEPPRWQ